VTTPTKIDHTSHTDVYTIILPNIHIPISFQGHVPGSRCQPSVNNYTVLGRIFF